MTMGDIAAKDVKALRDATGAGMMDAKRALIECDGDFEAASQMLREKGLANAATRSDRENVEGAVALVSDGRRAALVHLKCETDFSAKSDGFLSLVDELVNAVLTEGEAAVEARYGHRRPPSHHQGKRRGRPGLPHRIGRGQRARYLPPRTGRAGRERRGGRGFGC